MSMPMETIIPNSKFQIPNSEEQILAENGFFWREKDGVKVLVCRALEENSFASAFSTRLGGVSPFPENELNLAGFGEDSDENIFENRRRFLNVFENEYELATAWQVHGGDVKVVKSLTEAKNSEERFDALVCGLENVLVGVKTADCVPILMGDAETKAFAAVHAGWRGSVQSIAVKAIQKMREVYGTNPENLICAIGPGATCKNYEIGREVIEAFQQNFPNSDHLFTPTRENHALIDLHSANKEQLINAGVLENNIYISTLCTMERLDLFFSYRVEKKLHGKTGRLMSVIGLR